MFESHLKPPISFPSVSGAVCSFDSQYAGLPLKAHTVAVNAVQASGTPTPVNPLPISGWSNITITANSVPTVIQIGSSVYGGNYDAVSGVLTVTHGCVKFGDCTFNYFANGSKSSAYRVNLPTPTTTCASNQRHGAISSMAGVEQTAYWGGVRVNEIDESCFAITTDGLKVCIYDTDTSITQADFLTKYSDCQIFYPLATPQTIQLPPCPIDTLQGVNNIFADTGDTTLQYIKLG